MMRHVNEHVACSYVNLLIREINDFLLCMYYIGLPSFPSSALRNLLKFGSIRKTSQYSLRVCVKQERLAIPW